MAGTTGIRTYLEPDIAREVARIARSQGRSESAFIADAVRATLAKGSEAAARAGAETHARRLNRIEVRLDKLVRDHAILKESFLMYVRLWLEHNPPLEAELAGSLAASAVARFERFLDASIRAFAQGGVESLLAELRNDPEADDDAEPEDAAAGQDVESARER